MIPTDTGYAFCARVNEKDAVRRLLDIKGADSGKKPLALLCRDLASIDMYTRYQSRTIFKVLKKALPGPYTFVLPASGAFAARAPQERQAPVEAEHGRRARAGRRRLRGDPRGALDGEPLFCSSVPVSEDGDQLVCHGPLDVEGSWCSLVDFVVDAGPRPIEGSTIYDLAADDGPILVPQAPRAADPGADLVVA